MAASTQATHDRPWRTTHVVWELTLACTQACGHCGSRAGQARARELSPDEALRVVERLAEAGVQELTLIGGEAFLRPDWPAIALAATHAGMQVTVVSGGLGLGAKVAQTMAEVGVASVSLSLDGLEGTHDAWRGVPGAFRAAQAAMGHLRAVGLPHSVNTQINRRSLPELEALLGVVLASGAHAWQWQLTVPMGRAADRPEDLLQPHELLALFPRLAAIATQAQAEGLRIHPGNNLGYFGPHESLLRGQGDPSVHWLGCQAGLQVLGLESDGTLKACPSLPTATYDLGSVLARPIAEALDAPQGRFNRDSLEGPAEALTRELWGFCASCDYASVCRAGCNWTAQVLLGRRGNNPYCHHRALVLESQGLRERLVQVEAAPGLPYDQGRFELVLEATPPRPPVEEAIAPPPEGLGQAKATELPSKFGSIQGQASASVADLGGLQAGQASSLAAGQADRRSSEMARRAAGALALAVALLVGPWASAAWALGCVRSACPAHPPDEGGEGLSWTYTQGLRAFRSSRHFVGDVEDPSRNRLATEAINAVLLLDQSLSLQLTPRWSLAASWPIQFAERSLPVLGTQGQVLDRDRFVANGWGDLNLLGQGWLLPPEDHPQANLQLGLGLKLPTGGTRFSGLRRSVDPSGQPSARVEAADLSIQPGDGGWGGLVQAQGFWRLVPEGGLVLDASYLANPMGSNGVPSGQRSPLEAQNGIADQFLLRVGGHRGLAAWPGWGLGLGARLEGVPVRDLFGPSEGYRRPGLALSVEPSLGFAWGEGQVNLNLALPIYRLRLANLAEAAEGRLGDAAFADALVGLSYSHRFQALPWRPKPPDGDP